MFWKKTPLVVTHSGAFHTDDVFAVATLSALLGGCHKIIRTRDPVFFKKGDYVVDVGGEDNQGNNRFDHHQIGGAGARANGVPYSSFGLVWRKFGKELTGSEEHAAEIDRRLVQPIDMIDNGITTFTPTRDDVYPFTIDEIIGVLNSAWVEDGTRSHDEGFREAMVIAKAILVRIIEHTKARALARTEVERIYRETADKRIIVFEKRISWRTQISQYPEPLFIVAPHSGPGQWKVDTVRDNPNEFKNRKALPVAWAGKRDKELQEITGVPDASFCHKDLFVAGAYSKEGAVLLAKKALEA